MFLVSRTQINTRRMKNPKEIQLGQCSCSIQIWPWRALQSDTVKHAVKRGASYLNDARSCRVLASCGTSPGNWHSFRIPVLDSVAECGPRERGPPPVPQRRRRPSPHSPTRHSPCPPVWDLGDVAHRWKYVPGADAHHALILILDADFKVWTFNIFRTFVSFSFFNINSWNLNQLCACSWRG